MTHPAVKNLPNFITSLRIAGTIGLIFTEALSLRFHILYDFTGLTDVLDGFIARKYNLTSELGAKLDSIADLFFYAVLFFKVLPVLIERMPQIFWIFFFTAITIRIFSYGTAAIKFHQFASMHTWLNKLTSLTAFFIPLYLIIPGADGFCVVVCFIAVIASAHELLLQLRNREYKPKQK